MNKKSKLTKKYKYIGWREWVALPDFGIDAIKAKVDTGARTSALHALSIRYSQKEKDGQAWVSFLVPLSSGHSVRVKAPLVARRMVKSSLGHSTLRPVILTRVQVGEDSWMTEVTLVNRDPMGFRMLLGRLAVRGRFLVHPGRGFIQSSAERL